MTGRFCKTCRFMRGDRDALNAECHYWLHFVKTVKMPAKGMWQPNFAKTYLSPRLVWDDLPTAPELKLIGHDHNTEPLSENMDCEVWEPKQ
jgi:hypothetical protein